jgi:AraC family ethanolamine operon transcriptional activator
MKSPADSAQSPVTVVEINDPTAANAGIELLDVDAVQLQSIPMRVRRVIVRLETAVVIFHSTNLRLRSRTAARNGLLAYVTFGPAVSGTANGMPVRPGLIYAVEPGTEMSFVTNSGWESVTFLISPDDVRAHLAVRQREAEFHLPRGAQPLKVEAERVQALFKWGMRLVDAALQQPSLFEEQAGKRSAIQDELLDMLLAALHVADDFETTRSDRMRNVHSHIVRVAEKYALGHVGERLHVTDLCRAAAVSERALEYAFKEVVGVTPMNYLLRLRLHKVRQALLDATPESTTVSIEALNWGFWHFGEFSRAYKACFGELPSDTLRRDA